MSKTIDYNKLIEQHKSEIDKIISKAKREGYLVEGDKIISKNEDIIVIETLFRAETQYESYGDFYIQRQIEPLSGELLNGEFLNRLEEIKTSPCKKELFENLWNDVIDEDTLLFGGRIQDYKYDFLSKKDIENIHFGEDYEDSIVEISFKSKDHNVDGYMSVFKSTAKDLEKLKELNFSLNFSKVITDDGGSPYLKFSKN